MAAEIAAANAKSTMRPVGKVLIPKPAKRVSRAKRNMDREISERRCRKPVSSSENIGVDSDEDEEEGDEWLGKEEGFVSILFERFFSHSSAPIFETAEILEVGQRSCCSSKRQVD